MPSEKPAKYKYISDLFRILREKQVGRIDVCGRHLGRSDRYCSVLATVDHRKSTVAEGQDVPGTQMIGSCNQKSFGTNNVASIDSTPHLPLKCHQEKPKETTLAPTSAKTLTTDPTS
ncbi:hypothetical protein TNCV_3319611 [Trichonephila clavipes]|nr:hypothetical protein TNCV_3319611 [Trichonephila clavipes]